MSFQPSPSALWWIKNKRYFLYFLREISGVIAGLYVFFIAIFIPFSGYLFKFPYSAPSPIFEKIFQYSTPVVFVFTLIHSISWLLIMEKLAPQRFIDTPLRRALLTIGVFSAWIFLSVFLFYFFIELQPLPLLE